MTINLKIFKFAISVLFSTALIMQSQSAHAVQAVGNGGGAWVCRENSGSIRWSKLVDLFEATEEFNLSLIHNAGSVHEVMQQAEVRIAAANADFFNALKPYLQELNDLKSNAPSVTYTNSVLQTIDDSLYRIKPSLKDCLGGAVNYEQVVNYKNDGFVLVNAELFNSFDINVQAALILHEAIYKYRREVRFDTDSVVSRRMVGLIFSTLSTADLKKELAVLGEKENGDLGMKFSQLQPTTFIMGDPPGTWPDSWPDTTQHPVTITYPFEIQTTTVTQSQYAKIIGYNPSYFNKVEYCEKTFEVRDHVPMCPNNPVENVSYDDALAFIAKLNDMQGNRYIYRLPTEAEWEFAARGGTTTRYFFGNDFDEKDRKLAGDYGWFWFNSKNQTHEVAQKTPNPFGLYDMLGNVSQWVSDWYGAYPKGSVTDPTGPASGRAHVARPTACANGLANTAFSSQTQFSASRGIMLPEQRANCMGFRLVRVRRNKLER